MVLGDLVWLPCRARQIEDEDEEEEEIGSFRGMIGIDRQVGLSIVNQPSDCWSLINSRNIVTYS
jgi:hypothetical protein